MTKPADRAVASNFIESHYGKLDILVTNAGIGPADGLIGLRASESTEDELQELAGLTGGADALTRGNCRNASSASGARNRSLAAIPTSHIITRTSCTLASFGTAFAFRINCSTMSLPPSPVPLRDIPFVIKWQREII